jgi:hypothetical protein
MRDSFQLELYIRKLAKVGVRPVSITHELGEDPAQVMMRQVMALFDEYQSRENGKHVLRAMKENARKASAMARACRPATRLIPTALIVDRYEPIRASRWM